MSSSNPNFLRLIFLGALLLIIEVLGAQTTFPQQKSANESATRPRVSLPQRANNRPPVSGLPSSAAQVQEATNIDLSNAERLTVPFSDGQLVTFRSALREDRFIAPRNGSTRFESYVSIHSGGEVRSRTYWTLEEAGNGYFFIKQETGSVMEVKHGQSAARTSVWLQGQDGSDAQLFRFMPAGDDYYYIVPKVNSSLVLDVKEGWTDEGAGIWTHPVNRSNAQKFRIEVVDQPPLQRYKVIIYNMSCQRVDDPGDEIELYGQMWANIRYDGDDYRIPRSREVHFWNRSEDNPIELHGHVQYYDDRGQGPEHHTFIYLPEEDFNQGEFAMSIGFQLWEDDHNGPFNEDDRFRYDGLDFAGMHLTSSGPGSTTMGRFMIIEEEGDSRVNMVWGIIPY